MASLSSYEFRILIFNLFGQLIFFTLCSSVFACMSIEMLDCWIQIAHLPLLIFSRMTSDVLFLLLFHRPRSSESFLIINHKISVLAACFLSESDGQSVVSNTLHSFRERTCYRFKFLFVLINSSLRKMPNLICFAYLYFKRNFLFMVYDKCFLIEEI